MRKRHNESPGAACFPEHGPAWTIKTLATAGAITLGIMLLLPALDPAARAPDNPAMRAVPMQTIVLPRPRAKPAPIEPRRRETAPEVVRDAAGLPAPEKTAQFAPMLPKVNLAPDLSLAASPVSLSFLDGSALDFETVFDLAQLDSAPEPVFQPAPVYPAKAQSGGIEGFVELEFVVTEEGGVKNVVVSASAPPGMFEQSAAQAVGRWRFRPGLRNGRPVRTRVRQTVNFQTR